MGAAVIIASIISATATYAASQKADKRAKEAAAATDLETKRLNDAQNVNEKQASDLILKRKGRRGGGTNKARDTILTGPKGVIGDTQTGKTLLGQ